MVEGDALDIPGPGEELASSDALPSRLRARSQLKLTESQLERACKLAARGVDIPTIASALLLPEKLVGRSLRSRAGSHQVRLLRGRAILQELEHEEAMRELLPTGRKAIRDGLAHAPSKDAAQIGLKLHEAVIQKPPQRIEHTHQGRIEHDLSPIFERLTESLEKIREAQQGRNPLERVVRGDVGLALHRPMLPSGNDES